MRSTKLSGSPQPRRGYRIARPLAVLLLILGLAPLAVGAVRPRFGGTVALPLPSSLTGIDPTRSQSLSEAMLQPMVFDTLYAWSDAATAVPWLAQGDPLPSADRKNFRIKLRQGVRFHDGRPMRASAVVASLGRTLRSAATAWLLADLEGAAAFRASSGRRLPDGLQAVSDTEIELRFVSAVPDVRRLLAAPAAAITAPSSRPERPVGTGPFRVASLSRVGLELRANGEHFFGPPFVETVLAVEPLARNDEVRAFELGQLWMSFHATSVYGGSPRGGSRSLRGRVAHCIALVPSSAMMRDPEARRAVALAIDRSRLERLSIAPVGVLPASPLRQDLPHARVAMLRAAGRAGVSGRPRLVLTIDRGDAIATAIGEVLIASLDEIGVDLVVEQSNARAPADLRYVTLFPFDPGPSGLVASALGASADASRATMLLTRGDERTATREGIGVEERSSLIVLGLRTPVLFARTSLRGLRFDALGRLDLASAWIGQ